MSTYEDNWVTQPSGNKSASYDSYTYSSDGNSRPIPLPHENFDSYYDNFSEVDDFLTQTLASLQDLDIPVGEPSSTTPTYYNSPIHPGTLKGHKKQPSGTAIFGFAGHNKTLSIPGFAEVPVPTQLTSAPKLISPGQLYQEVGHTALQEPILFDIPHDMQMAKSGYYSAQQRRPSPPVQRGPSPANMRVTSPPHMRGPSPAQLVSGRPIPHSDDYHLTSKTPNNYKFPPSPPSQQQQQQHHHYQHHQRQAPQTVQVPVEYLQKLTSLIKKTEGIDMQKFLNYEFDNLSHPLPAGSTTASSSRTQSPQQSSEISRKTTPEPILQTMPQSQPNMRTHQNLPPPNQHQFHHQYQSQPQAPPVGLGISIEQHDNLNDHKHSNHEQYLNLPDEEPESEFSEGPKTPSPTLRSQAKFNSSPLKNELSWTPVILGNNLKRKPHDKATTLPPGRIDQYITSNEDKTFVCNYENCGKLFTRRYNVRSHVQTHLSDRPFLCDAEGCNKAFVRHHDLTRHKKIHEEFAFNCPCGKKFSRHDALYRHRIRQICCGGIAEDGQLSKGCTTVSTSPIKKKKNLMKPSIRIENDTVAKRLEFDAMKTHNKKSSSDCKRDEEPENVFLNDLNFDQFTPYDQEDAFAF